MYQFRPYQNRDLPKLAQIWNAQPRQRWLAHPVSPTLLDERLLSKPYFDRAGLIVATRGDQPVGFVHAGFGAADDAASICHDLGVTLMVMVLPNEDQEGLPAALITQSEAYLRHGGAKVLYAGGIRPLNPFYLGFYGGSELPGVLASDVQRQTWFRAAGYTEIDRVSVLHCELNKFRAPVNRQQLLLKRSTDVGIDYDPAGSPWWTACTIGVLDPVRFLLLDKLAPKGPPPAPLAGVSFWTMEPLSSSWGVRVAGLIDLDTPESKRRHGNATCLLTEAFRQLAGQGFSLVEAQAMANNQPAQSLYKKLGFVEIDHGTVLRK